ncbi:hypothetical protein E2320_002724 [Naja naja]|nr:hypothetical protein E2320_002724 [Naja naja]
MPVLLYQGLWKTKQGKLVQNIVPLFYPTQKVSETEDLNLWELAPLPSHPIAPWVDCYNCKPFLQSLLRRNHGVAGGRKELLVESLRTSEELLLLPRKGKVVLLTLKAAKKNDVGIEREVYNGGGTKKHLAPLEKYDKVRKYYRNNVSKSTIPSSGSTIFQRAFMTISSVQDTLDFQTVSSSDSSFP